MRFPLSLTTEMAGYMVQQKVRRRPKFPLVMMLEPLHACNLTCTGCGRIREYESTIKQKLSVDDCLRSVDEARAPIVSICGGEPLIYPQIGSLVRGILRRRKHIYLCTNGVFLEKKLSLFRPTSRFFFNVHLDGLRDSHDK
ncbi:MAG: radical SAM protein, partial [Gemmataceae bacterium]